MKTFYGTPGKGIIIKDDDRKKNIDGQKGLKKDNKIKKKKRN